ncbi:hypothetical protein cyc_00344 [Cyclospora cayetanensis]|uniref:Uncharacterized protein n=1 Tax=Cyclospora cayetanensis TaxID=88456 RepID=A0A1D3D803_9EIME|nr:hypothetical protein cyc_00344 [Cyclospora cayetanensis]
MSHQQSSQCRTECESKHDALYDACEGTLQSQGCSNGHGRGGETPSGDSRKHSSGKLMTLATSVSGSRSRKGSLPLDECLTQSFSRWTKMGEQWSSAQDSTQFSRSGRASMGSLQMAGEAKHLAHQAAGEGRWMGLLKKEEEEEACMECARRLGACGRAAAQVRAEVGWNDVGRLRI